MSRLAESEVVGSWGPPLEVICPKWHEDYSTCDCGFTGPWEWRTVYVWHEEPGHRRGDKTIRRDIARGLPPRAGGEGWWVIGGRDERCPECGDIERLDHDGEEVASFTEQAKVVVFMDARRQR